MFDKAITDTDKFADLPISAKALYFLLGMEADDEGFVSPRRVLRVHGGTDDDVKVLIAKGFLIPFESGVVVITNWHENNYLDRNRMKRTQYQDERSQLLLTDTRRYEFNNRLTTVQPEESSREESRVVENRIEENSTSPLTRTRNQLKERGII